MSKGILYIMTTSVEGLIKIGKTQDFNKRMTILEQNGYWNVSGLKRFFAVLLKRLKVLCGALKLNHKEQR